MIEGVTVEQCEGCSKKITDRWRRCPIYKNPAVIWGGLGCFFNTETKTVKAHVRVGQQKQKTRGLMK